MFEIFRRLKKSSTSWSDLSRQQQKQVATKMIKTVMNLAGPRYKVVSGPDQFNREQGVVETHDEDFILDSYKRGRMLDLARNAARNSSTFNAIMKQFDYNAVGVNAGKVVLNFDDVEASHRVVQQFAKWTRQADFFDGLSLNSLLKLILKEIMLGGDLVIMFDNGIVEDSGKLLIYESDEIGNTTPEALAERYGKYARQSQGRVYSPNGRFIGAIVSRSQRGKQEFDPSASYLLQRDPDEDFLESTWMMPRNIFRISQGRGISQMASSLATMLDLEDTCGFEVAAAKKNSQVIATILQNTPKAEEVMPSAFDSTTDFDDMTDEEIEQVAKDEASQEQVITLDKIRTAGVIYQVLPENVQMELLDTKHPNQNMPEFLKFLQAKSASVFGLTKQFSTLDVDDSNYKSQVLMSQPAFNECQKFLEQILDWSFYQWCKWAAKRGTLNPVDLPEDFMSKVTWTWNTIAELDEVSHQTAVATKLQNMTGSYAEYYGNNWREKLLQVKEEIKWCNENNLLHPSYKLKSGGESVITTKDIANKDKEDTNETIQE